MILYLDTTSDETIIKLFDQKGIFIDQKVWQSKKNQSEELLFEIDRLIKNAKGKKSDIKKIIIVHGPGSYTGVRVGLSTANALAYCLNIPIYGVKKTFSSKEFGDILASKDDIFKFPVMPKYAYPAKISKQKIGLGAK